VGGCGSHISGRSPSSVAAVTNITVYGACLCWSPGWFEGLVHVSEMSLVPRRRTCLPGRSSRPVRKSMVMVLDVYPQKRRIRPRAEGRRSANPVGAFVEDHPVGSRDRSGEVRNNHRLRPVLGLPGKSTAMRPSTGSTGIVRETKPSTITHRGEVGASR